MALARSGMQEIVQTAAFGVGREHALVGERLALNIHLEGAASLTNGRLR